MSHLLDDRLRGYAMALDTSQPDISALMREAADEIEYLNDTVNLRAAEIQRLTASDTRISELAAEVERLREMVRFAEEAEEAAKAVFWAVYPAYIEKHGYGISEEDAKRMRSSNEARILSALVQP